MTNVQIPGSPADPGRTRELTGLQERANKVIQQIADDEKFDLILQDPVVFASQRIDITEKVIKALADK